MPTVPSLSVAVLVERTRQPNRWEDWRFAIRDVLVDDGSLGESARLLRDDGRHAQWLFPGFEVTLHGDEAEGYYLNVSTGNPVWFVMWRTDPDDPSQARPQTVTLSYNEAGRLLDAQERVDNVPLSAEVVGWLQAYVDENYRPEQKRRQRPASFQSPDRR